MMKPKPYWDWVILVSRYGAFMFYGTEADAEEMRRHKARWEGGISIKRRATNQEIATGKCSSCWNHKAFHSNLGYRCGCGECGR
jgi:hypothetical protein